MTESFRIQELNTRNTITVEQALKQITTKIYEQDIKIGLLQTGMNALAVKITEIEKMVLLWQASSIGRGSTIK